MTNDAMGTTVPSVVDLRGLDLDLSIHDMLVWNGAEAAYCYCIVLYLNAIVCSLYLCQGVWIIWYHTISYDVVPIVRMKIQVRV